ncbi:acylneuraminate cytidylyltransferase family protein [Flammeovirgaceae bacterium SG7u.111]|nr:acylneuraminate cytidylyltransferase family protein [Flammeovirgaceae bacterium SG7u.132]WPO34967.1 acylneuraminate cytidylyltransferase family protein [Flammeovirgaceae bacterium SG7u.111]
MRNIAIIPARGGSKRLPNKNILPLAEKPLIHYTLEAVVNSALFETVILSSDDDKILDIGREIEGVTLEKREVTLAGDNIKVIDLVKSIAARKGYINQFETIGLFLPTCPFRTAKHIQEAYQLLSEDDLSVVSVTEMSDPVQLTLTIDESKLANPEALLNPSPLITGETRSQDFQTFYRVNGGLYIAWLKKFIEKDNFFQGKIKAYNMDKLHSVDIDYKLDLEWAEYLLKNNHVKI